MVIQEISTVGKKYNVSWQGPFKFVQYTNYTSSVNFQILELLTQLKNKKICAKIFCIIFIHDLSNIYWFYGTLNYKIGCFSCIYSYLLDMFWCNYTLSVRAKSLITCAWYYHADVILSRLYDTMYHTDVILHFRHVFDTVKCICERCSL